MVDCTLCISLDRRPDRWQQFNDGMAELIDVSSNMYGDVLQTKTAKDCMWPFPKVQRILAVDGLASYLSDGVPWVWRQGDNNRTLGMYGCYLSHIKCLEYVLQSGHDSALILEDDAIFDPMFGPRVMAFVNYINRRGWHIAYLGGEHMEEPFSISHVVGSVMAVQPRRVRRTHAYMVNGTHMITRLVDFLRSNIDMGEEVDVILWEFVEEYRLQCFAPSPWLVGQRGGVQSDIQVEAADGGAVIHQQDMWW